MKISRETVTRQWNGKTYDEVDTFGVTLEGTEELAAISDLTSSLVYRDHRRRLRWGKITAPLGALAAAVETERNELGHYLEWISNATNHVGHTYRERPEPAFYTTVGQPETAALIWAIQEYGYQEGGEVERRKSLNLMPSSIETLDRLSQQMVAALTERPAQVA